MSASPFDTARPVPPVPSSSHFTTAVIAYVFYGIGLLFAWPTVIAVIICHVRRGDPAAGLVDSHYAWLIRTFWWSALWTLASWGVIASAVWPIASEAIRAAAVEHGGDVEVRTLLELDWPSILAAAGLALVGAAGLLVTWLWIAYRVVRGAVRLGGGVAAP